MKDCINTAILELTKPLSELEKINLFLNAINATPKQMEEILRIMGYNLEVKE